PPGVSEDCLAVNVWSPELGRQGKRPVMVWLHGGGFGSGAADRRWTDPTHFCSSYDVVVVSMNHRLNIFGYLFLDDFPGKQISKSANVGMLDLVAALEWVQENVAEFGGDPDNVTLFGQSGGGSKVGVLMSMPSARGLFHKAIQMSGPGLRMLTREQATRTTL